ncbi:CRISPR-associated endonuclease Cas2 [Candidatus Parcubacteria bacterium]|nr:CRISPR-associated endonuclease Cas2 [Candidatus Parcubacteria bacterium]
MNLKNRKLECENLLLNLSDNLERLLNASIDRKKFWYWDSYYENKNSIKDKKSEMKIYSQIYHLEKFGYVDKKGFTIKGLIKIAKIKAKNKKNKNKWDKKWRVIIFDIPEKKRSARDCFRGILLDLGFQKLQNSVWISPYDNFEEIQEIIKYYRIEQFVVLMVVDKISNDLLFKKKFNL